MVTIAPRGKLSLRQLLHDAGLSLPSDCGGAGTCGKCRVQVLDSEGRTSVLACQYVPAAPVAVESDRLRPLKPVAPRSKTRHVSQSLRLAADIGTTTISLAAVDKTRRRVTARRDTLNPQVIFGADVMSRIAAGKKIHGASLEPELLRFTHEHGISLRHPVVAVGNTVMVHYLMGRNPASLGEFPYDSGLPLRRTLTHRRRGIRFWILPLLGSFVGSDCTAAILASGMDRARHLSLLVDAGTNGEVVLGNSEQLLVTSTAAGPAFEGAALECGSLAQIGAIKTVHHERDRFVPGVIGGGEARSICGSGVLDAVAEAVRVGRVDASGRVLGATRLELSDGPKPVFLSQADIREVQLAKGAIAAAIRVLLAEWGVPASAVERVYVTGKFGAAMNPGAGVSIGLLPRIPLKRIRRHGNLALLGAVKAALDPSLFVEAERLAAKCREVVLSSHPQFEQTFIDSMELEPWN